ncbi:unnamed protein product [Auanema sp. JU1783]|nr:unnamed protein product [Auanema sp. JU1783]
MKREKMKEEFNSKTLLREADCQWRANALFIGRFRYLLYSRSHEEFQILFTTKKAMKCLNLIIFSFCFLIVDAEVKEMYENVGVMQNEHDLDVLNELSSQLVTSLKIVQNMREAPEAKVAEKRRNKFEFIRFGRR